MEQPVSVDDSTDLGASAPAFDLLIEQLTQRLQDGERVDVEVVAAEHPAWAVELRRLIPALRGLADLNRAVKDEEILPGPTERDAEGRRIFGDFRIVREIGRGGMGIVYEAEQVSLNRRVALKTLPFAATMDPKALQRFQLEAQVAGLLQHPRIVTVYSVGLVHDVPHYAMRLIDGGSLADLLVELRALAGDDGGESHSAIGASPSSLALGLLSGRFEPTPHLPSGNHAGSVESASLKAPSIRGRGYLRTITRLGIQAAEALGYAHDQGVVHRDIKPANLLLDRNGDLWIADFGMANVQGDAGLTMTGDLPGTLRYMSPEQALGRRALVDRRTDLYSLGATLYEMLTLQPAVIGTDRPEIFRRIAEEEPIAIRRLNPAIPVDLATIVTKCLAKDPAGRYETAWLLAADLGRFLDGLPISARPVGPLARSWRWCRRKPALASLAAALAVALVVGFAGITWNWRKAQASERRALTQAAKADAINKFLIDKLLLQAAPEHNSKARGVTLRDALDGAASGVGAAFKDHPETEAAIRLALGQTYHELGEYSESERHLRRAYELSNSRGVGADEDRLWATAELGHILEHLDRSDEGIPLLRRSSEEARRSLGASHDIALKSTRHLAAHYQLKGRLAESEVLLQRVIADARASGRRSCAEALNAMTELGTLLYRGKRFGEAEVILRESLDLKRAVLGPDHPDTLTNQHVLARVLIGEGRYGEAEPLARRTLEEQRRVLGPEHPYALRSYSVLADVLIALGRRDEADALIRTRLEAQRRVDGPDNPRTVETARRLEALLKAKGTPKRPVP